MHIRIQCIIDHKTNCKVKTSHNLPPAEDEDPDPSGPIIQVQPNPRPIHLQSQLSN